MKNFEPTDQTFKAIRKMPLEVSFKKVKQWVNDFAAADHAKSKWPFLKALFPPNNKN